MSSNGDVKHFGSCHCGKVQFEVLAPKNLVVYDCNCSICAIKHNIHFVVAERNFKLLEGADHLACYQFNTRQAQHLFCKICGVQSFYKPRSNPDGYGINPNSLDQSTVESIKIIKYDGRNWEKSFEKEKDKPDGIQTKSK